MKILIQKIENTENIDEKIRLLKTLKRVINYHIKNYEKANKINGEEND